MSKYRFFIPAVLGLGLWAMNPLSAEAQRGGGHGGGGHGGGGHGGGGHGGGGHVGGGHVGGGHVGGGHVGGAQFGGGGFARGGHNFHGGGFQHGGGFNRGFFPGFGLGYGLGYGLYNPYWYDGGYGGYGYGGAPYYDSYYDGPSYVRPSYNYNSYSDGPSYTSPSYNYVSPGAPAAPLGTRAEVDVVLPRPDAQVWIDGNKSALTGTRRSFVSPPLQPGSYTYRVTAVWMEGGQEVRVERTVAVSPGRTSTVDLSSVNTTRRMPSAEE